MAEELKGLAAATKGSKTAKTYLCKEECYLAGRRYHVGDTVTTEAKLPDYWEVTDKKAAEEAE